jgi:aminopeptidase N
MRRKDTARLGRALILVLLGSLALFGCASRQGADGLGDPSYPLLGNGGYDVQHYTIDLVVDMEVNTIAGTTTIEAQATQALSAFNLDFLGLEISRVEVNGTPADYRRDGGELTITPAEPLADRATFIVAVTYSGTPEPIIDPGIRYISAGWRRFDSGVYVVTTPSSAMTWFPVNNHPTDKATYTFRITVPNPYVVAANGLLDEEVEHGDTTTYVWEASDPMASAEAAVNIAEFEVRTEVGPDGIPLRYYILPGTRDEYIERLSRTGDMIAYFSDLIGPYPLEAYGIVIADSSLRVALENQTMATFGPGLISEPILAHELFHQWFSNSVSLTSWQDNWLREGFGTYAEWLWIEHTQGTVKVNQVVEDAYFDMISVESRPPGAPPVEHTFADYIYVRGAWTLHALRLEVGDEVFFEILRAYHDRFKYGNASTADFIAVAEEVSDRELDDLFDAWLFAEEVPLMPELPPGD